MTNPGEHSERGFATSPFASRGWMLVALLLFCATAICLFLLTQERGRVRELTASRDQMKTAVTETRAQIDELSAKLSALASQSRPAAVETAERPSAFAGKTRRAPRAVVARRRAPAADPRVTKLQGELADQQKQLASTQEDLKKAREEMQGKLDSTRDELSGSIARNHDELVELQKRGERNFYEFELAKSKQFQKTGPMSLSLRKADTKHKRYDLMMLVDDSQLEKKRVNLYEPVLIYLTDRPQPVELVINQISKNAVKGYISEPKYKKSELASATAAAPARQPVLTPR